MRPITLIVGSTPFRPGIRALVRAGRPAVAAACLLLAVAGGASANELTTPIPPGGIVPIEDDAGISCESSTVADGEAEWHFVHTGTNEADLPADLFLTFSNPNDNQKVGGDIVNEPLGVVTYVTFSLADSNLLSAEDTIVDDGSLELLYVCVGGPPPEVPEAPAAILLPLLLLALVARELRRGSVGQPTR